MIPRAKTRQIKAPTLPHISSIQAHLLHQSVKVQGADRPKKEQRVTIRRRTTAAKVRLVRVGVEDPVEEREADHSQKFIIRTRQKSIPTVRR